MPTSEPMQVDISSLSEMEVIKEMDFLKRRKFAGLDGLSPPFFKDGGEVTSELPKLGSV